MFARPKLVASALALGALLFGLFAAGRAHAQGTTTMGTLAWAMASQYDRQSPDHETKGPDNINLADCKKNDYYTFRFKLTGVASGTQLQAWSTQTGDTHCNLSESQDQCHQVAAPINVSGMGAELRVYIRDIVNDVKGQFTAVTDDSVCMGAAERTVRILQFYLQEGANAGGTALTYEVHYDLAGPPAPTSVHAGPGENSLVVEWKQPDYSAMYIGRYYAYSVNLGLVDPDGGVDPDAGTDPDAGAGGAGDGSGCEAAALPPGMAPGTGAVRCGDTAGLATKVECTGLKNGNRYAVAVATVDNFYNEGVLSSPTCAVPEPVTGFFEAYRQAGGKGGGGYCTIGASRSGTAAAGVVLAALGLFARRARRRAALVRGAA